jgi:hypothetical protein
MTDIVPWLMLSNRPIEFAGNARRLGGTENVYRFRGLSASRFET